MKRYQITQWCQKFIKEQVQEGDFCIDATAGNGNDTKLLAELVGPTGKVLAFDIQEQALENTATLLAGEQLTERVQLICESHAQMGRYAEEESVSCIVFNFGYLPGGDHQLATKKETSIKAIEEGLCLLKTGGMMSLCIYSGKDTGFEERDGILAFLKTLDSKKYLVILSSYFNRPNNPPIPVMIIKL